MIIDSHTHNYREKEKHFTAAELIASMDEAGIDYSMLIADGTIGGGTTIEDAIRICEEYPRLKAIGCVEFKTISNEQIEKLVNYLKEGKIHAVKLYPGYENFYPIDKKLFPLYEACQEIGKPVIFHTGLLMEGQPGLLKQIHPLTIDEVANKFPNLKIIMAHFGTPWIVDTSAVVYRHSNVYVDLSGYFAVFKPIPEEDVQSFIKELTYYRDYVGDFRMCLFGTDWPLYSQKEYLEAVKRLPFANDEERELVFHKNAKDLFGLDV